MKKENEKTTSWPIFELLICYFAGAVLYLLLIPALDTSNEPRYLFLLGLSIIYWARIIIAKIRKEENKGYRFYALLILLSPIIWDIIEQVYRHNKSF